MSTGHMTARAGAPRAKPGAGVSEYFAHPSALVEGSEIGGARIGARTRVWAFAHVLFGARIGADCNICDHTLIEGGAVVGDRVTVKSGVQLWDGITVEDDVFIGPNATFTNDPFPRSRRRPSSFDTTLVRRGASIGANATILPGVTIGEHSMIGAGAVVTRDVPPRAIVIGNPGYVRGYVEDAAPRQVRARAIRAGASAKLAIGEAGCREPGGNPAVGIPGGGIDDGAPGGVPLLPSGVLPDGVFPGGKLPGGRRLPGGTHLPGGTPLPGGARLHHLPRISDHRGQLSFAEVNRALPFAAVRYFVVFGVPSSEIRGEHAHRALEQFLVCVHGACSVRLWDGERGDEIVLDRPDLALHVPPMIWTTQHKYSPDAVLLVLASDVYREEDYIRDLGEFHECRGQEGGASGQNGPISRMGA
jgi:UDP-2-acetamido-3-amino-2,3-dideoxy-glucuronate N-acetyltransferase